LVQGASTIRSQQSVSEASCMINKKPKATQEARWLMIHLPNERWRTRLVLSSETKRKTWKDLRWSLSYTHPLVPVQEVLRWGGFVWILEFDSYVRVKGVPSNLKGRGLCPVFHCPQCAAKIRVLWYSYLHRFAGCRDCVSLMYASQYREPEDVVMASKAMLVQFAETRPDVSTTKPELIAKWRRDLMDYAYDHFANDNGGGAAE